MKKHRAKSLPTDPRELPRWREGLRCKHCDDSIKKDAYCEECKTFLTEQCGQCHDEVVHDTIRMSNTRTSAGRKTIQRHSRSFKNRHVVRRIVE